MESLVALQSGTFPNMQQTVSPNHSYTMSQMVSSLAIVGLSNILPCLATTNLPICLIIDTFIHSYAVENFICHFRLLILTAGCLTLPAKETCDTFSGQLPSPAPCEIRLCHNILKNYTTTAMNHFRLI